MPLVVDVPVHAVRRIRVEIGDDYAQHDFGCEVSMKEARAMALHFVNSLTSQILPAECQPARRGYEGSWR